MSKAVIFFIALLLLGSAYPVLLLFRSTRSQVVIEPAPKVVGLATPLRARIVNPHGVRRVEVWLEEAGTREKVYETSLDSRRWAWNVQEPAREVVFTAHAKKDGKAKLVVEAQSGDLRGATDSVAYDVTLVTVPPAVQADDAQHYVTQGGSGIAILTPTGSWSEAGVRVGKHETRSFPKPGSASRFSLFPFAWDTPEDSVPLVYARNAGGSEATAKFQVKVFPKKFRKRDIELTEAFLEKVVHELDPNGAGSNVERFLKINREMRRANNQRVADLRLQTAEKFLWSGAFLQLANSKVESQFADVRSYIYHGQKIDEQVHLGFDLSVVAHTPVVAANDGRVLLAEPLGIYGNCIAVDHGYGLQSIYGHLSSLGVKVGDSVKKGQEIGRSGATGLAGGDHLHFTMQLDGVQVNPVEWWDAHWIRDQITSKLE